MAQAPSFKEELVSQIPAARLLMALGYRYLPPGEALALRGGNKDHVLLEEVLRPWLRAHNRVTYKGRAYPFEEANVRRAVDALRDEALEGLGGLVLTNQRIYEMLTLGTSLRQTIEGDTKSFTLHYIDWQHPERNVYHVTEEFSVEKRGSHDTRRPDLALFVNGIPLVVFECKRPDLESRGSSSERAVDQAISQMVRNQREDEIPRLFAYAQLLMATSVNEALFATTGSPRPFWALWREELDEEALHRAVNKRLTPQEKEKLYAWRRQAHAVRRYFDALDAAGERLPTVQDRTLYALLRPERLLPFIYRYVVYDAGKKKIARYQQYFAVEETVRRVAHLNAQKERTGGVIWHTTGSGKSLTMVMLAKALALHPNIRDPKVVIVTDRIDLDAQIWSTFRACGKQVERAPSGKDLAKLVRSGRADIVTTVIDKFDTVAKRKVRVESPDVFVLVDESHRSQYGTAHARMRQVFPNACYIGFTGTPLLKKEKSTARKFGGFIHKYTMRQAVEDETVSPLLYEGRMAELEVDQKSIDTWFERVTEGLTDEQQVDLKRKFSRNEEISRANQRLCQIAYDLSDHYRRNFQGKGFKAQLATASKATALKYKRYLDEFGIVTSEVIISPPDTREGHEEIDGSLPEMEAFWKRMMDRYGNEDAYIREIKADFAREEGVELLIVVDKLLVGFDEPRNTVLYIDKTLREHGLLQAIARVNRLFEGKDFGYIVDYRGVLGELNEAMETYNALEGYDIEDIAGTLRDVSGEIAKLPQRHAALWAVFKSVPNKRDVEALQQFLAPEDVRQRFYDALTAYAKTLKVALSAVAFHEETPEAQVRRYKEDLRFFHNLRTAVRQRYAEAVDYKDYELRVRKLLDSHIRSADVATIVEPLDIFDAEGFQAALDRLGTPAAKADTIAHQVKRTLTEYLDSDPAFYEKFSKLIEDAIDAYRQGRIDEAEYLRRSDEVMRKVRKGRDEDLPEKLFRYRDAPAYYGTIREPLASYGDGIDDEWDEFVADIAIRLEEIIEEHKVRDWTTNEDVKKEIGAAMDAYLFGLKRRHDLPLKGADIDVILTAVLGVAVARELM
jgi:type I restriction enzyme R subunit